MAVDLTNLVSLTTQAGALQNQAAMTNDVTVKALLNAQVAALNVQIAAEAQHQNSQAQSSTNLLNALGLMSTLTSAVGSGAPAILALFGK